MRTSLQSLKVRSGRLLGLIAVAAATLAITAENADARGRRGKSGCGGGSSGGGGGCGGSAGYGYASSGCNSCGGSASYGYASPGCNSCGGSYAPQGPRHTYNSTNYAGYAVMQGGCNTCDGGAPYAYAPAPVPQMAMNMPPASPVAPASGTTTGNGGIVQASGTAPASNEMGMRVVEVDNGPAQTAGVQQGAVIVSVDGRRVHTFDELQTALRNTQQGMVKMTFVDANGQRTTKNVGVKNNRIGVSVVPSPVSVPTDETAAPAAPRTND